MGPFTDEERAKACKCDKAPTDCNQNCRKCGAEFIKKCGKKYSKTCKSLGFGGKTGTCGDDGENCPLLVPTTCEDCQTLGIECVKQQGHEATCKALFWKKGKKGG